MSIASQQLVIAGLRVTANVSLESEWAEQVTDGPSLRRHILSNGAQRWRLTVQLEPTVPGLEDYRAAAFSALEAELGSIGTFTLEMPQLVSIPASQGSVTATGSRRSRTVQFSQPVPIGRFITFAGHAKVYQVSDVDEVAPPLRRPLANAAVNLTPSLPVRFAPRGVQGFAADRRRGAVRIVRTVIEDL